MVKILYAYLESCNLCFSAFLSFVLCSISRFPSKNIPASNCGDVSTHEMRPNRYSHFNQQLESKAATVKLLSFSTKSFSFGSNHSSIKNLSDAWHPCNVMLWISWFSVIKKTDRVYGYWYNLADADSVFEPIWNWLVRGIDIWGL